MIDEMELKQIVKSIADCFVRDQSLAAEMLRLELHIAWHKGFDAGLERSKEIFQSAIKR